MTPAKVAASRRAAIPALLILNLNRQNAMGFSLRYSGNAALRAPQLVNTPIWRTLDGTRKARLLCEIARTCTPSPFGARNLQGQAQSDLPRCRRGHRRGQRTGQSHWA